MVVMMMMVNVLLCRRRNRRRFYGRCPSLIQQGPTESAKPVRPRVHSATLGTLGPGQWAGGGLDGSGTGRLRPRTSLLQGGIGSKRLNCLQRHRDRLLAGLGPPQVGIHLRKKFLYRGVGQGLITGIAGLALRSAAVGSHRLQILLRKLCTSTPSVEILPANRKPW